MLLNDAFACQRRLRAAGRKSLLFGLCLVLGVVLNPPAQARTFRVATYNLENYIVHSSPGRQPKSSEARTKVCEVIQELNPDVLAIQEIGDTNALLDLVGSLRQRGQEFPHWEHAGGYDTNVFVAVLSKFPFTARRSHTKENFLLSGRRLQVSRAFVEVDIQIDRDYSFTLLTAHLKSKRQVGFADEAEMRLEEAKLLREKIDARLQADPDANLVVLGDFNDTKDSPSTRAILGRGRTKLVDTRPGERNGDDAIATNPAWDPRNITWTHYYGREDSYSRIDYLLLSTGMAREWVTNKTYILTVPNWGVASDHRPIVATFNAGNQ